MTYPTYGGQQPNAYQLPPTGQLPAGPYPAGPAQFPQYGAPRPERPKRGPVLVLSVALVVLLGLAVTFGTVYFVESGSHDTTSAALREKEQALEAANAARTDAEDKLDDANRKVKDAERGRDEARDQVAALTKCRDATRAFMDGIVAGRQDLKKEIDEMVSRCA